MSRFGDLIGLKKVEAPAPAPVVEEVVEAPAPVVEEVVEAPAPAPEPVKLEAPAPLNTVSKPSLRRTK